MAVALVTGLLIAACGGNENEPTEERPPISADKERTSCEAPSIPDREIAELTAAGPTCADAAVVAAAVAMPDGIFDNREATTIAAGRQWQCNLQATGPSGSGGFSEAICTYGPNRVEFTVQVTLEGDSLLPARPGSE